MRAELSLVASVGVAPIKFAAKIASDIDKPDGLRVVTPDELLAFLHALPVTRLWGVGEATREVLASMGLVDDRRRRALSGGRARRPARRGHRPSPRGARARRGSARGRLASARPVSVGHQETFDDDLDDKGELAVILLDQADRVARAAARRRAARARRRARSSSTTTFARSRAAPRSTSPTSDGGVLARTAIELLAKVPIEPRKGGRVRLCGISAHAARAARRARASSGSTRPPAPAGERLGDTIDKLAAKFGRGAIRRAVHLPDDDD